MRPITVIRAVQVASVIIAAWSSAMPWGDELGIGKGPPSQFERQLVGAVLLLALGAAALMLTGRKATKPGPLALAVLGVGTVGAIVLTLTVRSTAMANEQAHVLMGGGWLWMAVGSCLSLGALGSAIGLRFGTSPGETKARTSPKPGSGPKKTRR